MIKAKVTWRRGHLRHELRGRNTDPVEAAALIAGICRGIEGKYPDTTVEDLLNAAKAALEAMREEDEKGKGLRAKCCKPEDTCEHFGPTGWCDKYGMKCEEVPQK